MPHPKTLQPNVFQIVIDPVVVKPDPKISKEILLFCDNSDKS